MNPSSIARYSAITIIALILIAFTSWYVLIRGRQETLSREDAGRGTEVEQPSFSGAVGSTYQNIVSSLSTIVGGERAQKENTLPRFTQLSKTPVAGFGFVGTSTSLRVRFVERSTGYVLDVDPKTGDLKRVTNTLVPAVYNALILKKGVVLQSLNENGEVLTAAGTVTATSSTKDSLGTLSQKFLPNDIRSIVSDWLGEKLLYALPSGEGITVVRSEWDGTKRQDLFSSSIKSWRLYENAQGRTVLTQSPADGLAGFAYVRKPNGDTEPLFRALPGLTVLPHPSSDAYLYGLSNGPLTLYAKIANASSVSLPIRTIADKCVWKPDEKLVALCAAPQGTPPPGFLDGWYRGEFHTSDAWWRIDIGAASAEPLYTPGLSLDVERPMVDEFGIYLVFINARDKSLWRLRIKE